MRILKSGSIFCILFVLGFSASANEVPNVANDHAINAATNAERDIEKESTKEVWIDVRSGFEYSMGHVEGAHHIPYDEVGDQIAALMLDKDTEIHLYCRSGGRAGKALKALQEMGYTNAHNDGGINDLQHDAAVAD